jgi:hypothetical protein
MSNKFLTLILVSQLFQTQIFAAESAKESVPKQSELNLQEITLPSEVKDLPKQSGSIYYNSSVKNKVLIPVHIWGDVKQAGLHFLPSDTSFIKGLSLAGGPGSTANLEEIKLIRTNSNGSIKELNFDLSRGGDQNAHEFKIESGDTVFVKKDTFMENRSYYTGLISIALTIASTFFILKKVDK